MKVSKIRALNNSAFFVFFLPFNEISSDLPGENTFPAFMIEHETILQEEH